MAYIGTFQTGQILYASEMNRPFAMCLLRTTTVQAVATATATTCQYNNTTDEVFDTYNWHDSAFPARVIPTDTGYYMIDTYVVLSANAGTGAYLAITKNGTTMAQTSGDLSGSGANSSLSASVVMSVTAGDYIDTVVFQNSGGSINITNKGLGVVLLSAP